MKSCHIFSLSLSPKAALTTCAPCFEVDVPCHEHVPKGKSLWWTSLINICLRDRLAARGKWDTETTPEENISKGSRIQPQPGTLLSPIGDIRACQGSISTSPSCQGLSTLPRLYAERQNCAFLSPVKSQSSAVFQQHRAWAWPELQINTEQLLEVIGVPGSRLEQKEGSGI